MEETKFNVKDYIWVSFRTISRGTENFCKFKVETNEKALSDFYEWTRQGAVYPHRFSDDKTYRVGTGNIDFSTIRVVNHVYINKRRNFMKKKDSSSKKN